jgi:Family of unknown function (DUF6188)
MAKFILIAIKGHKIKKLNYAGFTRLIFDDEFESYLEIHSEFKITKFNQIFTIQPIGKEALMTFFELINIPINVIRVYNSGELFISFDNETELFVEDGPSENWHFTSIKPNNNNLFIHGGMGSVY